MSEFIGLLLVSISILGLIYSIGNLITIRPLPTLNSNSLDHQLAFYQGYMASKQPNNREVKE